MSNEHACIEGFAQIWILGNLLKANINFLVSAGYNTFSAMPSSAKEPTEDIYTSSYSSNGVIVEDDERLAWETPLKAPGKSEPSEASNAKELSEDFYTSSDSPKAVADPDLQIRGGPGHLDPEIRGGPGLPPNFSRPFGSHFGQKLSGGAGPPGPIPWIHHCKGMIFPDDDSPAGDTPMEDPEESETLLKSTQHEAGHDPFGGARAKEKKSGSGFSLGNTKQNGKEQVEQG